jgi:hypothetical protein
MGKQSLTPTLFYTPVDPHTSLDLLPKPNRLEKGGGFILLWKTNSFPAKLQSPLPDFSGENVPLADPVGAMRIVDMPLGLSSLMHRTVSLGFGTVLKGEVVLELDDMVENLVKGGGKWLFRGKRFMRGIIEQQRWRGYCLLWCLVSRL